MAHVKQILFYILTITIILTQADEINEPEFDMLDAKYSLCDDDDEFLSCQYPIGYEYQFRGDVRMTDEQVKAYFENREHLMSKMTTETRGVYNPWTRWPNNEIPVYIDAAYSVSDRAIINQALQRIQSVTCFTFPERTTQTDYIWVQKSSGCWSYVGRIGNAQVLSLADGCVTFGIVMHEFIHAIGYHHMQTARNRDEFVKILWQNIEPGKEHNFEISPTSSGPHVGQNGKPYDYDSIMHYGPTAFASAPGLITIQPLQGNPNIGQRYDMSIDDINEINADFCSHVTTTTSSTTTTTMVAPVGCQKPICTAQNNGEFYPHVIRYMYWRCVNNIAVDYTCGAGLVWNPTSNTCDYNGQAKCAS
uniref:Metalloendopeptidase n=1 Tax=Lutzomyia reovirus 2 TaxID=1670670 RepID=A0A0H4M9A8_9REOV|nr:hypothetical protein [Lutzomyia reovirus 2]